MSVVGHKVWMHMQGHYPRYSQKALSKDMKETGVFVISPQSISNYLRKEHPPIDFLTAVIDFLNLSEEDEDELRALYFRGSSTEDNRRKIDKKREEFRQRSQEKRKNRDYGENATGDSV